MDFELSFSAEIETFRMEVSAWMDAHAPAMVYSSDPRDYDRDDWEKRVAYRKALGAKGWLYPTGNPKYGGGGLTVDHAVVITQEMEKRKLTAAQELGGRVIAVATQVYGAEEQKDYWVPRVMKGEIESWQLLTEPQGGSDLASARTTAILDGDDYIVNGQKIFVGAEHRMEYGLAIVNTDPGGARHRNLSYLIIPLDAPGVTIQPLYLLSGSGSHTPSLHKNIVFFDDVRVPSFNRVGGHNQGWEIASINMELEHGGAGEIGESLHLTDLVAALRELEWNGRPLIEDPDVRELLGEVVRDEEALRLFGLRNYWMSQTKQRMGHEAPQWSCGKKVRAHSLARRMIDTLGHYALARDPKYILVKGFLELWQRSSFVEVHWDGGLNIQSTIIARRLGLGRNAAEQGAQMA